MRYSFTLHEMSEILFKIALRLEREAAFPAALPEDCVVQIRQNSDQLAAQIFAEAGIK